MIEIHEEHAFIPHLLLSPSLPKQLSDFAEMRL